VTSESAQRPSPAPYAAGPFTPGGSGRIERVLVLADATKEPIDGLLPEVEAWLNERVSEVIVHRDVRHFREAPEALRLTTSGALAPELVVVLGGDGSILSAARAFRDMPVPTIGINFGQVGFLAPLEVAEWQAGLTEVLDGKSLIEPRMRLVARLERSVSETPIVALNDIVLSRGATQGMVKVGLEIGGQWVSDYRADGLILATPSGSTAYSLAAGGPLLAPSMEGIIVTPVCPHALSHRPLVLHPASEIRLSVIKSQGLITLGFDGHKFSPLQEGDAIIVQRHPEPYPLLTRPDFNPWRRLRDRLGWRGSFTPFADIEVHHTRDELDGGGGL